MKLDDGIVSLEQNVSEVYMCAMIFYLMLHPYVSVLMQQKTRAKDSR